MSDESNNTPRAGFGVGIKFAQQSLVNSRLKGLSDGADTLDRYNEIKDSRAMKGTAVSIYRTDNGQTAELDTKSEGRWMITTEDIGVASLANLSTKYIVDGVTVKVDQDAPWTNGKSPARFIGEEIRDYYKNWLDWKSIKSARPQDREQLLSKIHMQPALDHPANADRKSTLEKYITKDDKWLLTLTPLIRRTTDYQPTIDLTTAFPIALLLNLPISLRQLDIRLNPLTGANVPLDEQRDADGVYICTDERLRELGVLKDPDGSLPADFRAFITLCTIFAVRAPFEGLTKGPKECSAIIPRNDFKSLFNYVQAPAILAQSCTFPQSGLNYQSLNYTLFAYVVAALAIGVTHPAAILDADTLASFKKVHFIWGAYQPRTAEQTNTLSVLEWLNDLSAPGAGADLLTAKDKECGDGSIGRLGARWEIAAGRDAPIFEFREMKGYLVHEDPKLDLAGKLDALNSAFWAVQNPAVINV